MVFLGGTNPVDSELGQATVEVFSPVFEQAILELWSKKYAGRYQCDSTTIDIFVNFTKGSIEVSQMQFGNIDMIEFFYEFSGNPAVNRTDLISYIWPGIDDVTYRYFISRYWLS